MLSWNTSLSEAAAPQTELLLRTSNKSLLQRMQPPTRTRAGGLPTWRRNPRTPLEAPDEAADEEETVPVVEEAQLPDGPEAGEAAATLLTRGGTTTTTTGVVTVTTTVTPTGMEVEVVVVEAEEAAGALTGEEMMMTSSPPSCVTTSTIT